MLGAIWQTSVSESGLIRNPGSLLVEFRRLGGGFSALRAQTSYTIATWHHRKIQAEIEEDVKRAELLTKDGKFNERHCLRCFDKFTFLFNPKVRCAGCRYNVCKKCAPYNSIVRQHTCTTCLKQRYVTEFLCDPPLGGRAFRFAPLSVRTVPSAHLLVSPGMGHLGRHDWSLRLHNNLAISISYIKQLSNEYHLCDVIIEQQVPPCCDVIIFMSTCNIAL